MGQKINPFGLRVCLSKDWRSRWFANKTLFPDLLHEDLVIREVVRKQLSQAAVSRIQIERFANRIRITVNSARPGLVFGRKRIEYDALKDMLHKLTKGKDIYIDVVEIKKPELDAQLIAENVATQMERRIGFRRAMKKAVQTTMDMGALGIKIRCGGRLGGVELARSESYKNGTVPLQTLRANIDYGFAEAMTSAGKIGVKTWVCKPEQTEEDNNAIDAKAGKIPKSSEGKPRRKRLQKQ